jgi:hypothetical protein
MDILSTSVGVMAFKKQPNNSFTYLLEKKIRGCAREV